MRKMKAIVAAAVVGFGLAGVAQAAPILSAQLAAVNPPASSSQTLSGYTAFVVQMQSDLGPITGGDFHNSGGGVVGTLHQRWTFNEDTEAFQATPKSTIKGDAPSVSNFDSHWITNGTIAEPNAASENQNSFPGGLPSTATARYGHGDLMRYAFALDPLAQAANVNLVYLVLPDTGSAQITGQVTVLGDPNPHPVSLTVAVPEPASMGMLAVAACGLLARRRRA